MKILTIGDIHGKNSWKDIICHDDYNKVIFVGDYVDDFELSNIDIIDNLKEIIDYKDNNPDKVTLLLGNHDIQYILGYPKYGCTGFRAGIFEVLNDIFTKHYNKFQLTHQIDNYIWSHAGIHKGWYKFKFLPEVKKHKLSDIILEDDIIANQLNKAFEARIESIFDVCPYRGGYNTVGGPLWADKTTTYNKPLDNYHQIVGHTAVDKPITHKLNNSTSITYVDCLTHMSVGHELWI